MGSRYVGRAGLGIGQTTDSGRAAGPVTVGADRSHSEPKETIMNPIRNVRRVAGVLAGLASAWLGLALAAPAAFAVTHPTPGPAGYVTPGAAGFPIPGLEQPPAVQVHTVVVGGMPGWQIALIAIGAALLAAIAAVLADRAWAARRRPALAA
jgi:hypothetical protein